jgi:hypothetical protein
MVVSMVLGGMERKLMRDGFKRERVLGSAHNQAGGIRRGSQLWLPWNPRQFTPDPVGFA